MFASRRRTSLAGLGVLALTFARPADAQAEPAAGEPADEAAGGSEGADGEAEPAEGDAEGDAEVAKASAAAPDPAAERPPMIEVLPKDKRVRHDWYIGFGWGGGVAVVRGASLTHSVGFGGSGFIHAGGRVRDPFHVGARLSTITGGGYGASSILVEALFFPLVDKGLMLAAAVGPSLVYPVAADTAPGSKMALQNGKAGLAVALDLGYDFWVLRRFNVGVVGRADAAVRPGIGVLLTGTLGLSFNWY